MKFQPPNVWKVSNTLEDRKRRNDEKIFNALNKHPLLAISLVDSFQKDDFIHIEGVYLASGYVYFNLDLLRMKFQSGFGYMVDSISIDTDMSNRLKHRFGDVICDLISALMEDLKLEVVN